MYLEKMSGQSQWFRRICLYSGVTYAQKYRLLGHIVHRSCCDPSRTNHYQISMLKNSGFFFYNVDLFECGMRTGFGSVFLMMIPGLYRKQSQVNISRESPMKFWWPFRSHISTFSFQEESKHYEKKILPEFFS